MYNVIKSTQKKKRKKIYRLACMKNFKIIASSAIRGILPSQKLQFFILATHFLMPTPTESPFH